MSNKQGATDSQTDSELNGEILEAGSEHVEEDVVSEIDEQPADPGISIEELQKQLTAAEKKVEENWDKAVRTQAEMENLKKRMQKDLENAHKYALEKFAKELLSVIDSLELGLQAATGDSPEVIKFREGSELTIKQFEAVFAKFNIEAINPLGQPFNPEVHQAMTMQPSSDVAPNTVLNVFQKGYMLNGRLLRPAMVVVAKAEDKPADDAVKVDEQA